MSERIVLVVGHAEYYPQFGFSAERASLLEHPVPGCLHGTRSAAPRARWSARPRRVSGGVWNVILNRRRLMPVYQATVLRSSHESLASLAARIGARCSRHSDPSGARDRRSGQELDGPTACPRGCCGRDQERRCRQGRRLRVGGRGTRRCCPRRHGLQDRIGEQTVHRGRTDAARSGRRDRGGRQDR